MRLCCILALLSAIAAIAGAPAAAAVQPRIGQPASGVEDAAFEVASIKLNTSGQGPRLVRPMPGGQFAALKLPLSDLIQFAYGFLGVDFRFAGIPAWAGSTSYDITAKMPASRVAQDGTYAIEDMRTMVRNLLRDRFQYASHRETRELPMYVLAKSRGDGRLGSNLRPSGPTCPPIQIPAGIPAPPPPPPGPGGTVDPNCTGFSIPGFMAVRRTTMPRFADMLSIFVARLVADRTGLDGTFDLDLSYLPDPAIATQGVRRPAGVASPPGLDPNGAELFTAIQEQLGLKLESIRGPVEVVVVDRLEPGLPD